MFQRWGSIPELRNLKEIYLSNVSTNKLTLLWIFQQFFGEYSIKFDNLSGIIFLGVVDSLGLYSLTITLTRNKLQTSRKVIVAKLFSRGHKDPGYQIWLRQYCNPNLIVNFENFSTAVWIIFLSCSTSSCE